MFDCTAIPSLSPIVYQLLSWFRLCFRDMDSSLEDHKESKKGKSVSCKQRLLKIVMQPCTITGCKIFAVFNIIAMHLLFLGTGI